MKRQLIAALLALNVAAVAVPSATFTVSAAEEVGVEAQSVNGDAIKTKKDAALADVDAMNANDGPTGDTGYGSPQSAEISRLKSSAKADIVDISVEQDIIKAEKEIEGILKRVQDSINDVPTNQEVSDGVTLIDKIATQYVTEDQSEAGTVINDATDNIQNALTNATITKAVATFKEKIAAYAEISKTVADAKKVIADYFPAKAGNAKEDAYGKYNRLVSGDIGDTSSAFNLIKTAFDSDVSGLTSKKAIDEAVTKCKADLDKIWTIAEANTITATTKDALKVLEDYLPSDRKEGDYTNNQISEIKNLRNNGVTKITNLYNAYASEADIKAAFEDAKAKINAVKTSADVQKSVADVIAEIDALGEIKEDNYNAKYDALVKAEESFEAVEGGAAGQKQVTNSKKLTDARNYYDQFKVKELKVAIEKLGDLTDTTKVVTLDTYRAIKAELDRIESEAKKIKTKETLPGTLTTAKSDYATALLGLEGALDTKMSDAFTAAAASTVKEVTDKNKAAIEEAIRLYKELAEVNPTNGTVVAKKAEYSRLVSLWQAYQDKQQAAEDRVDLAKATVTLEYDSKEYTGEELEPSVTVTNASGEVVAPSNYIVRYKNNVNVGEVKVTVIAVGSEYKGSNDTKSFKITEKALTGAKVSAADMYYYNGTARNAVVTVSVDGKNLANGTDYTVVYKNNKNIGKATAEITGKGNYAKTVNATYVIKPAKSAVKSLKAGKKKLTVKTAKQPGAKYQIAYKVKGGSYKTVKTSNVSKTIKSLKSGKTYAVKIRAYKSIDGKTYYGRYSAVKTVKVK